MWIGSIRLRVYTHSDEWSETDEWVRATIMRDGVELHTIDFDYEDENDLERGAIRSYYKLKLPLDNDKTPVYEDALRSRYPRYPPYGVEFSDGLEGHLSIRVRIFGDNMWVKDQIDLEIREMRPRGRIGESDWYEQSQWHLKATWPQDRAITSDFDEGRPTFLMYM